MKLHANKPGMVVVLDDLRQDAVGRHSGETHAALLETSLVRRVDFVTMTMAFGNFGRPIYLRYADESIEEAGRLGGEGGELVDPHHETGQWHQTRQWRTVRVAGRRGARRA